MDRREVGQACAPRARLLAVSAVIALWGCPSVTGSGRDARGDATEDSAAEDVAAEQTHDGPTSDFVDSEVGLDGVAVYYGQPSASMLSEPVRLDVRQESATYGAHGVLNAGDVDGDGFADLLVAFSPRWMIYRGSPTGISSTPSLTFDTPLAGGASHWSVRPAGDLDGDSRTDLVGVVRAPSWDTLRVLQLQSGASGDVLRGTRDIRVAANLYGLDASGDVTGDGVADVLLPRSVPGAPGAFSLEILMSTPSGLGATATTIRRGPAPLISSTIAGDLDCDGYPDIVGTELTGAFVHFYAGDPAAPWARSSDVRSDQRGGSSVARSTVMSGADISGCDVVVVAGTHESIIFEAFRGGIGSMPQSVLLRRSFETAVADVGFVDLGASDLNGDGVDDLVVGRGDRGVVVVFNGLGGLGPSVTLPGIRGFGAVIAM